ncbi:MULTISPECIES: RNA polymerase sigma factor [unclassified Microcoleus]|uniref:RNA polymerase sigma factor n=1 Tax=unclassified Microcoleus TaxID=2642155 RepID=UPI002FD57F11
MSNSQFVNTSCFRSCSEDIEKTFWQLWEQNRDYFYRCCLKWMGGNSMDAEEALSRAMVKAWDKLPDYAEKITNLRAWLTRLTHNLCIDIHRERRRKAIQIDNIEDIATIDNSAVISGCDSPELALLNHELGQYLREAINSLPYRLRAPFTMRYCDQISYQDIAQKLAISLDNIYKRIQQARDILQKRLSRYLSGLDDALLDFSKVGKREKLVVESSQSQETIASDSIAPMTENIGETINYQVTAICLETLHSGSYRSLSPLGWS